MSTKTVDVEAAIERLEAHATHKRVDYSKDDLRTLLASHAAQAERIASLEAAIRWALGESDDFPTRETGQGAYWWRTELRRLAILSGKDSA